MSLVIDHLVLRLPASGLGLGSGLTSGLTPGEARELAQAVARRLAGSCGTAPGGPAAGSTAGPRNVAALDLSLRIDGRGRTAGGGIEELADEIAEALSRSLGSY